MTKVDLKDVPETMLWTLYNRASEANRQDAIIKDDKAIEIYQSIEYDYEKSFGRADQSFAVRSLTFDREISAFIKAYPECYIINLGEGLETQRFRFTSDKATWVSVDLPEAMEVREQFIKPDKKHLHIAVSALDRQWFDTIPKDKPVFVTAQGLFMYLQEKEVKSLVIDMINTFQQGFIMFDTVPIWISLITSSSIGLKKTWNYTLPKMPWGINRNQISEVKNWSDKIKRVREIPYAFPRGLQKYLFDSFLLTPILNRYAPTMVKVKF